MKVEGMPQSETEELGLPLLVQRSGGSKMGVPIKKRRIPLVRSPSPPPRAASPTPEDIEQPPEERLGVGSNESNASSPRHLAGKIISSKGSCDEDSVNLGQRNGHSTPVHVSPFGDSLGLETSHVHISVTTPIDEKDLIREGKSEADDMAIVADDMADPEDSRPPGSVEVGTSTRVSMDSQVVEEGCMDRRGMIHNSGDSSSRGNTETACGEKLDNDSITLRDDQVPVVNDGSAGEEETGDKSEDCYFPNHSQRTNVSPIADVQNKGKGILLNVDSAQPREDRAHWDLNTMMETWESPSRDTNMDHESVSIGMDGDNMHEKRMGLMANSWMKMGLGEPEGIHPLSIKEMLPALHDMHHSNAISNADNTTRYKNIGVTHIGADVYSPVIGDHKVDVYDASRHTAIPEAMLKASTQTGDSMVVDDDNSLQNESSTVQNRLSSPNKSTSVCVSHSQVEGSQFSSEDKMELSNLGPTSAVYDSEQVDSLQVNDNCHKIMPGGEASRPETVAEGISNHSESPSTITVGIANNGELLAKDHILVSGSNPEDKTIAVTDDNVEISYVKDSGSTMLRSVLLDGPQESGPGHSRGLNDGSESDKEEKINISADSLEDDPYDSEYESDDGSQYVDSATDKVADGHDEGEGDDDDGDAEDDDDQYEDGELRESWEAEDREKRIEAEHAGLVNMDNGPQDHNRDDFASDPSQLENSSKKPEEPDEIKNINVVLVQSNIVSHKEEQNEVIISTQPSVKGSEVLGAGIGNSEGSIDDNRSASENKIGDEAKNIEIDKRLDPTASASRETHNEDGQVGMVGKLEKVKSLNLRDSSHSASSGTKISAEKHMDSDEGTKTAKSAVKVYKNRIISLVRPSNEASLEKSISSCSPRVHPFQSGRARFGDASFRRGKSQGHESRDENLLGAPSKFERDGERDSLRSDNMHVRGRGGRQLDLDPPSGKWGSNRKSYSPDRYPPSEFGSIASKNAVAFAAAKIERDGFVVAHDGTVVKPDWIEEPTARTNRRSLNSGGPQSVHETQSRRRSPSGRGGPGAFGMELARAPIRNIDPERIIGASRDRAMGRGPGMVVGSRREKFRGALPQEDMDPSFLHRRCEPFEYPIVRRERSFSPMQKRESFHFSRVDAISPSRPRSRSPPLWPSHHRRSAEGVHGQPVRRHSRSPPPDSRYGTGLQRMRSPRQHPRFQEDMMDIVLSSGRHDAPAHSARWSDDDLRDFRHNKQHGYSKSYIANRNPPGRLSPRGRRYPPSESPERMDAREYFKPVPSRRFEFGAGGRGMEDDGYVEVGRGYRERHGMVRSLRPYNMGSDVEGHLFHMEDGFRPYGSRNEGNTELHGRSESRDYDGRLKDRLGNNPRKLRSREEEEDDSKFGRHGWRNANFEFSGVCPDDDVVPPSKRRRF
ncbi:uncharacterized protein LOC18433514 isoform X1 [Amborella trichopoda]|uniref:uncharacterized protein LOC18433514 isoform X1 n=1 Tax=Amborella trichopoda TaxID=13333 RepID=UPI0005D3051F|nr:uncharacterized protein LOC18433514 isoform X1 [Amborella trichopoda]XP_011623049.1 uncharacterized protein LOC18433514 isoform X1 [Amborella trichopoda]XP_020522298.1 uncharacterized protein LOC18433514 isoform X1 [Amborella trichopoda]|eukprot:XP_011623048.1 uncharacterized protein LOC18433514 isoform X1 [Amborella trichopoda]